MGRAHVITYAHTSYQHTATANQHSQHGPSYDKNLAYYRLYHTTTVVSTQTSFHLGPSQQFPSSMGNSDLTPTTASIFA